MKRIFAILLAAALLLSGCGGTAAQSQTESESVSQIETWGPVEFFQEPAEEEPSAPETSPASVWESVLESAVEPEPEPEPEPLPESLLSLVGQEETFWTSEEDVPAGEENWYTTIPVWVDGRELTGILAFDTTLVRLSDVAELCPALELAEQTDRKLRFTGDPEWKIDYFTVEDWEDPFSGYNCVDAIYFPGGNEEYWLPLIKVCQSLGATDYLRDRDGAEIADYVSTVNADTTAAAAAGTRIPVLEYHAVSDDTPGIEELYVSPSNMRAQLQYLVESGYDPIFFSDLSHIEDYDRPIILTFDDGYDSNYEILYPMLQEFGVKATIFVITGMMGDQYYFTAEQAREMADSGLVDIQSHTVDHYELGTLSYEDQQYQLSQSRLEITRITKRIPYVLAYPSGSYNSNTLSLMPEYYRFGLRMNGGDWYVSSGADNYEVTRTYISRYHSMEEFMRKAA